MNRIPLSLLSWFGLLLLLSAAAGQNPARSVEDWIAQLGSDHYAEREAAGSALEKLGPAALGALRRAAQHSDQEIRRRARDLVRKIERKQETDRLLQPRQVSLSYKDTPVLEAVEDLARKSRFLIRVEGDKTRLRERKITLQIGPTSFWEAFQVFCQKAGLNEAPVGAAEANPQPTTGATTIVIINRRVMPETDILKAIDRDKLTEIVLTDGTPPSLPGHLAGNLRVRALPPRTAVPNVARAEGEALLALDVTSEPSLICKEIVAVSVDRAVDERDRKLTQRWLSYRIPVPPAPGRRAVEGEAPPPIPEQRATPRLVPVCLRQPDPPCSKLKELSGTISALVLSAPEPLVTIDNILKANGQSFKGERAGLVRVLEVSQEEDEVRLRIEVQAPPRSFAAVARTNQTVIFNGQVIGSKEFWLTASHFTLVDKGGKAFEAIRATYTGREAGAAHELELAYRVRPGQAAPVRFVYTDRRSLLVEVPFKIKNVPLQ